MRESRTQRPQIEHFRDEGTGVVQVDQYLSTRGRLVLLESVQDVQTKIPVIRRNRPAKPQNGDGTTLSSIVEQIVGIMESKCPVLSRDIA